MGPVNGGAGDGPNPIDEEFEFHLSACAAELERTGLSPGEARAEAERRFGRPDVHHRACRREAPEERMGRVMRWTLAATIVVLAGATVTLGTVAWRQSRELADLSRKEAAASPAMLRESAPPPLENWATYEDGTGRVNRFTLVPEQLPTANGVTRSFGAGRDGKPYRITVIPTNPRPRRLDAWKLAGRNVILVDGLEAITYVRDPMTPAGMCDFQLMSGDRIEVSQDQLASVRKTVAPRLSAYSINGDVRHAGRFSGDQELDLRKLMVLAGGYSGPEGTRVEVRIVPHARIAERVRQWKLAGGRVIDWISGPALVHRGDLRQNTFWEHAPAIEPDDQVTVARAD